MKIKVYAPPFASYEHIDSHGYLEIQDGATLKDLFRKLKIPFAFGTVLFCKVNYDKATLDMKLKDGDVLSFYSSLTGG